jgi:hypothetical protein
MRFRVDAAVGNSRGIFDAAYSFGNDRDDEGTMTGTPQEIGESIVRFLEGVTPEDCQIMKYGTEKVYFELLITPIEEHDPAPPAEPPRTVEGFHTVDEFLDRVRELGEAGVKEANERIGDQGRPPDDYSADEHLEPHDTDEGL